MWTLIVDRLTEPYFIPGTLLSFFIPWLLYRLNRLIHKYGDPPWKKEENE